MLLFLFNFCLTVSQFVIFTDVILPSNYAKSKTNVKYHFPVYSNHCSVSSLFLVKYRFSFLDELRRVILRGEEHFRFTTFNCPVVVLRIALICFTSPSCEQNSKLNRTRNSESCNIAFLSKMPYVNKLEKDH